jgi:SAM-dependent methyltransferase
MANELTQWYVDYKGVHGDTGYSMERSKHTSRVAYLEQFVRQYTPIGGSVLDVGCGDMYLAKQMPEYSWKGIDIAPDASNNLATAVDLMKPPYPLADASFDTVVCSEVLEHLWDLRVVHKEVFRVLKPGGVYIVSTPNFDNIDHHLGGFRDLLFNPTMTHSFEHIRFYNHNLHEILLKEAGYVPIAHTGCDAHYVRFFEEPRRILGNILRNSFKLEISNTEVDMLLGQMFNKVDHTIMLVVRKPQ